MKSFFEVIKTSVEQNQPDLGDSIITGTNRSNCVRVTPYESLIFYNQ